jgi:hypothetical protein
MVLKAPSSESYSIGAITMTNNCLVHYVRVDSSRKSKMPGGVLLGKTGSFVALAVLISCIVSACGPMAWIIDDSRITGGCPWMDDEAEAIICAHFRENRDPSPTTEERWI